MPVQPPTRQQLEWIAGTFPPTPTRGGADVSRAAARAPTPGSPPRAALALGGFRRRDELADEHLPVKYPRVDVGHRPVGAENPSNGWSWRCSIPGAPNGPLQGKTIGVKDNVCVAGIPMLNGSPLMEGYVPREDATVV